MDETPRESQESLKKLDQVAQWLNLGPKSLRRRTKPAASTGGKPKRAPSVDVETFAGEMKKKPETKKLKKKLNDVAAENDALAKELKEKNHEIADLKRSVESLHDVLNSVPIDELRCNSSIASSKILELSKKNRSLRAELETVKGRLSKKDLVLQKIERDLGLLSEKYKTLKESMDKTKANGASCSGAAASDVQHSKTAQLQQKVFESRNRITELQTQLKLAHKCLQQEVGEPVNVQHLLSGPSTWRGRAQQILHLQQKVHELKDRIEAYERGPALMAAPPHGGGVSTDPKFPRLGGGGAGGGFRGFGDQADSSSLGTATSPTRGDVVRRSELQHRAKLDKLEKEMADMRQQLAESRQKVLALKVRNKTINDELLKYKMKTSTLEEQTDYHGINLDRLNDELNAQKQTYEQRLQQLSRKFETVMQQREQLEMQLEDVNNQIDNLKQVVGEREAVIEQQAGTIEALQSDMKALCGDFLFACRDFRREEFLAILEALETEKSGLIEHIQVVEVRLDEERTRSDTLNESLQKSKLRLCRMEAKIRELTKELETQAERKKRSQRVSEYANSLAASSSVGSFVFENSAAAAASGGKKDIESSLEFIELKHQLEFANEKISMLGDRLRNLVEEKSEDANRFEAIVRDTKAAILDTISGRRHVEREPAMPEEDDEEGGCGREQYAPMPNIPEVSEENTLSCSDICIAAGKNGASASTSNRQDNIPSTSKSAYNNNKNNSTTTSNNNNNGGAIKKNTNHSFTTDKNTHSK